MFNKNLIIRFTKREIQQRFHGSVLGLAWSFLVPLLMLAVYTFVFSFVFNARWGVENEDKLTFALILFSSLIPYSFISEILGSSTHLILNNVNLVKKVAFPLNILPIVRTLSVFFHTSISILLIIIALIVFGKFQSTILYLPILLVPLVLLGLASSYLVSALTVFVRDVSQITTVLITLLLFICPIFYPLSAVPEKLQFIIMLNPFAMLVEQFRNIIVIGNDINYLHIAILWLVSVISLAIGFCFFNKSKEAFADVL